MLRIGVFLGIRNNIFSCTCFNVSIDTLRCLKHQQAYLEWTQLALIKETHMPCRLASA